MHNDKIIESTWEKYRKLIPDDENPEILLVMRGVFFAGFIGAVKFCSEISCKELTETFFQRVCEEANHEKIMQEIFLKTMKEAKEEIIRLNKELN
jgi:hypothetical protein